MTARAIRIGRVQRFTVDGVCDEIDLEPGVNVLVGVKDTGKTGWLHTISFLLGDTDTPEKGLGTGVASKFDNARLHLLVSGEEEVIIERRWKESGARQKVFVNGEAVAVGEFSEWINTKLGIPNLHFPRGNPYSPASWAELSWRMLFRHIYREERFWSDLADKQPEREQHACILQFLGAAEKLYPKELGDEVRQRELLLRLRARKEQFDDVLQQAAKGLLSDPSISNAPTRDSIALGIEHLRAVIGKLQQERDILFADALSPPTGAPGKGFAVELELAERRAELSAQRDNISGSLLGARRRLEELSNYRRTVSGELTRIRRVEVAEELFRPLSVTRCPHCDQKVSPGAASPGTCFVCHQHLPEELSIGWRGARRRLEFEHEQLEGEDQELTELVRKLKDEEIELGVQLRNIDATIAEIDVALRPVRSAIAAFAPLGLAITDTRVGQMEERVAQLLRLQDTFEQRDRLAQEIDELAARVQSMGADVDRKSASIPFEGLSDAISDGINEYLNLLKAGDPQRWTHQRVRFQIGERSFKLLVGDASWSNVGATSSGLVALGYHYALLKLSGRDGFNYPGLALVDFPMTLADGASIAGKENYLVEPFVSLASANANIQVVICGRAFRALKDVNRISLTEVWKQGDSAEAPAPIPEPGTNPSPTATAPAAEIVAQRPDVSSVLELVGAANFHSNEQQIMIVFSPSDTERLAARIPALAAAIAENVTWRGKDVLVSWSGGRYVTKLIHHIDIKVVKFTIRKKDARPLWNYLDALLRTPAPRPHYPVHYTRATGSGLDEFRLEDPLAARP